MKSNIKYILIFAAAAVVCAVIWLAENRAATGSLVRVEQNGELIGTVDLSKLSEPYEFTASSEDGGFNTIRCDKDGVEITEADCPDKICVNQGKIYNSAVPIVCLPHRLVVSIVAGESEYDAAAGR